MYGKGNKIHCLAHASSQWIELFQLGEVLLRYLHISQQTNLQIIQRGKGLQVVIRVQKGSFLYLSYAQRLITLDNVWTISGHVNTVTAEIQLKWDGVLWTKYREMTHKWRDWTNSKCGFVFQDVIFVWIIWYYWLNSTRLTTQKLNQNAYFKATLMLKITKVNIQHECIGSLHNNFGWFILKCVVHVAYCVTHQRTDLFCIVLQLNQKKKIYKIMNTIYP